MEKEELARIILPTFIVDTFEVVNCTQAPGRINFYLDEKPICPSSSGKYLSKGFTKTTTIQDFPIRGKETYLYIRRRKWLNTETNEIISRKYDLTHVGTSLTHDFVAFLKDADRI